MSDGDLLLAQQMRNDLDELYWKYHSQLPKCEGLLLRPNSKSLVQYSRRKIRRAKLTLQCSTLNKIKPRKKKSLARVGIKAERLAKSVSYKSVSFFEVIYVCFNV